MRRLVLLGLVSAVAAAQPQAQGRSPDSGAPAREAVEPMRPDEPMPTGMSRPGIKKGDVEEAETQKRRYMEEMMEQEKAAVRSGTHPGERR